ncbi:MAG: response regulator [bacterium]|nr:response regulator [bacterium]
MLVVDDERGPREALRMILQPNYEVRVARDGSEALRVLRSEPIALVTLDLSMPGIHGEELMRIIRQEFPEVELVIITGHGSLENATQAIRYGVADYLQKPFDVVQVSASVFRCLSRRRGRDRLVGFLSSLGETIGYQEQVEAILEQAGHDPRVGERIGTLLETDEGEAPTHDNLARSLQCLEVLANTVETQSVFLRGHARRTGLYSGMLAERLKLPNEMIEHVRIAGFLHDVGKIGIPTELLTRPDALDPKELAIVEKHPEIGTRLVAPLGVPTEIVDAIRHHHEWWDGRGYGDGLFGEQIPISARIVAIADAFDAMSCDRPYRSALAPEIVRLEIERYAGVQFDPTLAKEFLLLTETSEVPLQVLAEAISDGQEAAA